MNIIHICLSSHYTEGMAYQDNLLPLQNAMDGHKVTIISDCYTYDEGILIKVEEEDKIINCGIRLIRMEYDKIICNILTEKVRKVKGLFELLVSLHPDVILFHGTAGWELHTVAEYKKKFSHIKLFVDSHQDLNNSAKNHISYLFLHKLFYKSIVQKVTPFIDKFLYISYESGEFLKNVYGVKDEVMEFYPLGGNIINKDIKKLNSVTIRKKHGFNENDVIIVHTGKLDKLKRTDEIINAFKKVDAPNLKLIIAGSIPKDMKLALEKLISSDKRILYLGWQNIDEITKYISAADLYFQPGSQSSTMQSAICCGTAIALYPYKSHEAYMNGNGFWVKDEMDFVEIFNLISKNRSILIDMSKKSYNIANELLDYRKLAARLY